MRAESRITLLIRDLDKIGGQEMAESGTIERQRVIRVHRLADADFDFRAEGRADFRERFEVEARSVLVEVRVAQAVDRRNGTYADEVASLVARAILNGDGNRRILRRELAVHGCLRDDADGTFGSEYSLG